MSAMDITSMSADVRAFTSRVALQCDYQGARYHVWVHADTLELVDDILYKNPSLDATEPTDLGFFRTRRMSVSGPVGRVIVPVLLRNAPGLMQLARQELRAQKDAEEAIAREEVVARAERAVGPALCAAARDLLEWRASLGDDHVIPRSSELEGCLQEFRLLLSAVDKRA